MKTINSWKAQTKYSGVKEVESATIVIDNQLPEFTTFEEWDAVAEKEARTLEEALYTTLPGGIYDRLAGEILHRVVSHFRVSHNS
jgi:hypothetical protein